MDLEQFMENIIIESDERINKIHHITKKIWKHKKWSPIDIQNKCLDVWDKIKDGLGCNILPLVPVKENTPISNLIFGSGSFSTGEFQIQQYRRMKEYLEKPPLICQGIVTNKSKEHKSNALNISIKFNLPLIELDYIDWYHDNINKNESNPIRASRYWFQKNDLNRPSQNEINKRFSIRQNQFHKELGEEISKILSNPTDIVSARGYNFQFCSNIFNHQKNNIPHVNDTHPADLSYINPKTKAKLYAGWQSGAVKMMMDDNHKTIRGCLIEVNNMDKISQIDELDEGVLLSLGKGITPEESLSMNAQDVQTALKIIDDYFFCTLEPTGLILLFGVTDKKIPVIYHGLNNEEITIRQKAVVVGNKLHSGINAWGNDLTSDIKELEEFFSLS